LKDINWDLRVIRTRESIREAFVELLEEKGFKAVTVKDITTRAKINRGTFYMHYQDKYDLMNRCQEEFLIELSKIVKQKLPDVIDEYVNKQPITTPFPVAVSIFEYLDKNRKFMKALLGPKGDSSFQIKMKEFMWKTLFEDNQNPLIKQDHALVPAEYFVSYVSSAHLGVIQQWLNGDRKETPQEMARIIFTMTFHGPLFAIGLKQK
jgi:AcrR family transcriptional regulator